MEGADIIDGVVKDILNIRNTFQMSDADLRAYVLRALNRRAKRAYRYRYWSWRIGRGNVTITNQTSFNGAGDVPSDFATFGKHGMLAYISKRYRLRYLRPQGFFTKRDLEGESTSARPLYYTLATIDATTRKRQILVHKPPPAGITLLATYERLLTDITDAASESGTDQFPEDFAELVLFPGTKAEMWEGQGDGRVAKAEADYNKALVDFWKDDKEGLHVDQYASMPYGDGFSDDDDILFGGYLR